MKRLFLVLLVFLSSLVKCNGSNNSNVNPSEDNRKQYTASFLSLFDTVTYIVGLSETKEQFEQTAQNIHDDLEVYHKLFDIYNTYEGINNIKVINDNAGIQEVKVDSIIIDFLLDCKEYYEITNGKVNVAMGSVLSLWHDARENAYDNPLEAKLPDDIALKNAKEHIDFDLITIDEKQSTVYISDPLASLDVGAIAKGYAVEKLYQMLLEEGADSVVLNIGGNLRTIGNKPSGEAWVIGLKNPDTSSIDPVKCRIEVGSTSVVTSGNYERFFYCDGVSYNHIIDPVTLLPADYFASVTIVAENSGLADALSTALFCMSYEDGVKLVESIDDVDVVWIFKDGTVKMTDGISIAD